MFAIDPNPQFWAPVKVLQPGERNPEEFQARFRALTISEFKAHDLATPEGSRGFLVAVLVGADDLCTEAGDPIVYGDEVREQLLDLPHVRAALIRAYLAELDRAARGN